MWGPYTREGAPANRSVGFSVRAQRSDDSSGPGYNDAHDDDAGGDQTIPSIKLPP